MSPQSRRRAERRHGGGGGCLGHGGWRVAITTVVEAEHQVVGTPSLPSSRATRWPRGGDGGSNSPDHCVSPPHEGPNAPQAPIPTQHRVQGSAGRGGVCASSPGRPQVPPCIRAVVLGVHTRSHARPRGTRARQGHPRHPAHPQAPSALLPPALLHAHPVLPAVSQVTCTHTPSPHACTLRAHTGPCPYACLAPGASTHAPPRPRHRHTRSAARRAVPCPPRPTPRHASHACPRGPRPPGTPTPPQRVLPPHTHPPPCHAHAPHPHHPRRVPGPPRTLPRHVTPRPHARPHLLSARPSRGPTSIPGARGPAAAAAPPSRGGERPLRPTPLRPELQLPARTAGRTTAPGMHCARRRRGGGRASWRTLHLSFPPPSAARCLRRPPPSRQRCRRPSVRERPHALRD